MKLFQVSLTLSAAMLVVSELVGVEEKRKSLKCFASIRDVLDCGDDVCGASERLGVVLDDLGDLNQLDDTGAARLLDAVHSCGVVVVPGQKLTRHQQVELSNKIGKAVVLPSSFEGMDLEPGEPAIHRITNYWANGTWKGEHHSFGAYWHQDGEFWTREQRYLVSILYAEQAPPPGYGGQTGFGDTRLSLESLSAPLRKFVEDKGIYASVRDIDDFRRHGLEEHFAAFPEVKHPFVDTHPSGDGVPILYVGSPHMRVGTHDDTLNMTYSESSKLLNMLIDHSTSPSYAYYHQWKTGDVVFWDNTQTLHRAMPFQDDGTAHRELYRTQARLAPSKNHLEEYA